MQARVFQLNQSLSAALERLRARDAQCDQLEAELKLVQNATLEYKLLLYLLLRQRACAPPCVPADCVFTKGLSGPLPVEA
ncbi:Exodeoxyribonuclease 7 large subunit [Operophtera brumata]|uniref:Exodeoxyribonuclease 7 large subunit n=1 Tax=Operophtera brumata TaxID=104452 RepID=A0A0L7LBJ2_OPEBR|nr:Exodeoxyribonuclease 7 large subunit [Operophtera brumata]